MITEKKKEYIGDAIIHMALSIYCMEDERHEFKTAMQKIWKLQSNSHLADVARDFKIIPNGEVLKQAGFKKYADAVEIHVYNLYKEYGLDFTLNWVTTYIIKRKVNVPKKLLKQNRKKNNE